MAALCHLPEQLLDNGLPSERFYDLIHPDDREFLQAKRALAITTGDRLVVEFRTARSSRTANLLACGRFQGDGRGNMVRGRGIVLDVTGSRPSDGRGPDGSTRPATRNEGSLTPLDRAADHALAARRAIDDLGALGLDLRPTIDALLMQIGHHLSATGH